MINERGIQNVLFHNAFRLSNNIGASDERFFVMVPNFKGFYKNGYECDIFGLRHNMSVSEFEIKRSLSDYYRDFSSKQEKHEMLKQALDQEKTTWCPNEFWFVFHGFSLTVREIPKYAGLIQVSRKYAHHGFMKVIKPAPSLGDQRMDTAVGTKIVSSLAYRYWNMRVMDGLFS